MHSADGNVFEIAVREEWFSFSFWIESTIYFKKSFFSLECNWKPLFKLFQPIKSVLFFGKYGCSIASSCYDIYSYYNLDSLSIVFCFVFFIS